MGHTKRLNSIWTEQHVELLIRRAPLCLARCSSAPALIGWRRTGLQAMWAPDLMLLHNNARSVLLIVGVSLEQDPQIYETPVSKGPRLCSPWVHSANGPRKTGGKTHSVGSRHVINSCTFKIYNTTLLPINFSINSTESCSIYRLLFTNCTAAAALVIHYITARVNGSREARLGDPIFNENGKCIAAGHCWYSTMIACAFISKVIHSEDYATSSGDGSMLSVQRGTACSTVSIYIQMQ